jgi:hypothetical protein
MQKGDLAFSLLAHNGEQSYPAASHVLNYHFAAVHKRGYTSKLQIYMTKPYGLSPNCVDQSNHKNPVHNQES